MSSKRAMTSRAWRARRAWFGPVCREREKQRDDSATFDGAEQAERLGCAPLHQQVDHWLMRSALARALAIEHFHAMAAGFEFLTRADGIARGGGLDRTVPA